MIVTLKNKSELFAQGGVTGSGDSGGLITFPLSFCGLHTIQTVYSDNIDLNFPIDDSVNSIGNIVTLTSGKVFTDEDFEITGNRIKFKKVLTQYANSHRALIELVKTNGGVVKKHTPILVTMECHFKKEISIYDNLQRSSYALTGFYGPIKASEIIAWNVLPKLRATGKTNEIWNSIQLTTNNYTQLVSTRNPDCWIGDLDISGIPIGNTVFETWSQANMGCLIAPQVGIGVGHWTQGNFASKVPLAAGEVRIDRNLTAGRQVCFKGNDGVLHVRTVIASTNFNGPAPYGIELGFSALDIANETYSAATNLANYGDALIYLLDRPLPPSVRPVKFPGAWMFESESDEDNSEKEELLLTTELNEKNLFAGIGFHIDQFKIAVPVLFNKRGSEVEAPYNFRGITAQLKDRLLDSNRLTAYRFTLNGYSWSQQLNQAGSHPTGNISAYFKDYYKQNPNEQPPPANPAHFFNDPIYHRYHGDVITGDSGTPYFFEGDNGELGFVGLCSGGHAYLFNYEGLPTLNRIIDDMKTFATYTGTVEYPQIMAKPTNTSKVERL